MNELIFIVDKKDKEALGSVRCMEELKAAVDEKNIWLRGLYDNRPLDKAIQQLPLQHSFYIDENNLLFAPGSLTPVAVLPVLEWIPIAKFISVEIPVAALPGRLHETVNINIIPSVINKKGAALLTTLAAWKAYAEAAPAIRLAPLQFAVSQNSQVLIIGDPLPAIPGKELWRIENILIPNGYDLEIPMAVSFINEKLNAQRDALLIFDTNGSYEKVDRAFFVAAKRSGIRLTQVITE